MLQDDLRISARCWIKVGAGAGVLWVGGGGGWLMVGIFGHEMLDLRE